MPNIYYLVKDIYALVQKKGFFDDELTRTYGEEVGGRIQAQFNTEVTGRLRLSKLGSQCPCALWHSVHTPELAEPLPSWAQIKYSFGHMIEALALSLAKAAGHSVVGEQDELILDGIVGHRDAVIDGCIVDVKSTSSRGFIKFKDKTIAQDDSFGYLDQLDAYVVASYEDPLVTVKDKGYILAIDKQLGHMVLYEHVIREENIRRRIKDHKETVNWNSPPKCTCRSIADGESGNMKLDVKASYSPWKYLCKPNLRTFLYSDGPRYLTTVKRLPRRKDGSYVPEVDKHGNFVYN